ncbi:sulfatase-like hydrolase/transferase [Plantactinospora sp. KLBMP9567]|uniref:sulfatase-like hydrolase/transferase n=1 Tax=Plantactinospora sp. KLBMP9567 TaxID=3085900 RepID=UPI002982050E|nr:sulfatase-like hydrolase/transferase [Plantactinospora sp. KLBMP9567]MDW5326655.1 sulfatase [Plantactinospora sp. KLBMP9567]
MSLFTRFRQVPDQERTSTTDDPPPGGRPGDDPAGDDDTDSAADPATPGRIEAAASSRDAVDPSPAGHGESAGSGGGGDGTGGDGAAEQRHRSPVRRIVTQLTTVLAALLVLLALTAGNKPDQFTLGTLARIPVEALLGVVLVLALRPGARRAAAVLGGVGLGLLALLKIVDMGFHAVLARQFDPVLDWILLDDGISFLTDSFGRGAAIGAAIVAALLAVAVVVLTTLAVLRLTDLVARHSVAATRTAVVLGAAWLACAVLGVQIVPGVPVAARNTAGLAYGRAQQIRDGLRSQQEFSRQVAVDAFRDVPGDRLLTGLRGKDVLLVFVESYGRDAVEDPEFAPQVGAVLDAGTQRLAAAGFAARSAYLTSPTTSSGSWLAHSTFLSGLWIDNQQRYRNLVTTDRLTLTGAFRRANWRTVGIMPGVTRAWPEGELYDYERIYDSGQLGYHGPKFSWATMPDQYALAAFERYEHGTPNAAPLMAGITLVSSHAPWTPTPRFVDWDDLGDGSVFAPMAKEGEPKRSRWVNPAKVRADYRQSVEYSLNSLISYVEKYGDDDTVVVFLGDHQPSPVVTGAGASRDVPITVVAHDPAVLDRISRWGWQDGLKPGPRAPVWRMDSFRDRFLTAFGPRPSS